MTRDYKIAFSQKALANEEKRSAGRDPGSWPREILPIALASTSVMSTAELAAWAQIGKNSISRLTAHFGIKELTGNAKSHRFSVHEVMRKIIGIAPRTADEMQALLKPLQKASWVSGITGMSTSAINAAICENRLLLPAPLELTRAGFGQAAPRGRRWIPAQLDAYLLGAPVPFLPQEALPDSSKSPPPTEPGNVFAAICTGNARASRHRQL
ncbi:hypothetical protein [Leisingera sp. M658]|uniref:hypothetical protein n=1 Tax=Leisingera sp. M658 TaxID=2867015 RepID=UPI0021A52638|nr:hypothetical protein [Leisingera sp. M658]UWQ74424.1 hypothetical protein K3724_18405 [Leisingera sp. M658]